MTSIRLSYCLVNIVFAIEMKLGSFSGLLTDPKSLRVTYGKQFFERALHAYQWCPKNYTYDEIVSWFSWLVILRGLVALVHSELRQIWGSIRYCS